MARESDTTTVFKADITDFKAAMQEAARQVRLANSEFKAATAGMDDWSKSTDGLSAKTAQLNKVLDAQKRQLDVLETEYKRVAQEQGEDSRAAQELQIKINNQKATIATTETQLKSYEQQLNDVENATEDAGDASEKAANGGFTILKGVIANLATEAVKMAITGLKNLASEVVETGTAFESSMAKVSALSGATGDDLALLTETAREYGKSTQFSASEAADALGYMALAGWDAQKSAAELGGVLNLAAASGMGLAEASDMVTDYLSAFSNSAMTATEFSDKLAYAQANSNTSAIQLGEAYRNSAANLNAAGQDVETVTALLSAMANQGLKGSKAGTALSAVMRDLTKAMVEISDEEDLAKNNLEGFTDLIGKNVIMIGEQAVAVSDTDGNFRDLTDILAEVEAATASMGDAEKASALQATFTTDSIKGLNLILNEGIDNTRNFEDELRSCNGAAADMAAVMNDNLAGDMKALNSAFDEFKLNIYDSVNTPLRDVAQSVTKDILPALTDMINGVEGSDEALGEAVGGLITNVLDSAVKNLPRFAKVGLSIVSTIALGLVRAVPDIVKAGVEIINELLSALGIFAPELIVEILRAIPLVVSAILGAVPDLIKGLFALVSSIVSSLPEIIQALLEAIPQIISAVIDVMMNTNTALIEGVTMLIEAIAQALPELLPIIIDVLPTLIQALVMALVAFSPELLEAEITLFETFLEALPIITEAVLQALPELIIAIVSALVQSAPLVYDAVVKIFWAFVDAIPVIVEALKKNVPKIVTAVIDGLKNLAERLSPYLQKAWEVFSAWALQMIGKAKEYAPIIRDAIIKFVQELPEKFGYFLGYAIGKMITFSQDLREKAREAGKNFFDNVVEFFKSLPAKIAELLLKVIEKLPSFISDLKSKAKDGAKGFFDSFVEVISDLPSKVYNIAKDIVTGLYNGISDMKQWLYTKIGEFAGGFTDGIKKALGIASPSKVMRDEVGKWLALGISEGFGDEIPQALKEMRSEAKSLVDGLKKDLSVPLMDLGISADSVKNVSGLYNDGAMNQSSTGSAQAAGAKVQNVTFNQYNTSPKSLDRLTIYRDTNSLLFSAKVRLGNV